MKKDRERARERLNHIKSAIDKIEHYTKELQKHDFCDDSITNEAVLFQLSIIGEAIIHIDNDILKKYNYPWHKVRALRNVITHEYFGIQLDKIWSIIQDDFPELNKQIETIIENEF